MFNININPYQKLFGGNEETHRFLDEQIQRIIRETLSINESTLDRTARGQLTVDLYNLKGQPHDFGAGRPGKRIVIYINTTCFSAEMEEKMELPCNISANGIFANTNAIHQTSTRESVSIFGQDNVVLAEWFEDKWELNILFDLFGESVHIQNALSIFQFIIYKLNELVFKPRQFENSWVHAHNKQVLSNRVMEQFKQNKERLLADEINRIRRLEEKVESTRRQLKSNYDQLQQTRRFVENEKQNTDNVCETLVRDLDLIAAHEKVEDLQIIDSKFHIFTIPLYFYTERGERFYGGRYRFTLNLENSEVKIFNEGNNRRGYFSRHDPHPHVNGEANRPCLGNAADSIAELSSQMQLYALTLVVIDFLETVNTGDPAGRVVTRWDRVDDEGNVIQKGIYLDESVTEEEPVEDEDEDVDIASCRSCEDTFHIEELNIVYEDIMRGELRGEHEVCHGCRDEHYRYIRNNIEAYVYEEAVERCDNCDESFETGTLRIVYSDIDEEGLSGEHEVCEECRDEFYVHVDEVNEYVNRNNISPTARRER